MMVSLEQNIKECIFFVSNKELSLKVKSLKNNLFTILIVLAEGFFLIYIRPLPTNHI